MRRFLFAPLVLTLLSTPGQSSWGGGGCPTFGPVGPPPAFGQFAMPIRVAQSVWLQQPDGWWRLYHGSQVIGAYHPEEGFCAWLGYGKWGEPTDCPECPPVPFTGKVEKKEPVAQNFGIDWDKMPAHKAVHSGKPITAEDAVKIIEQANLEDDSLKPHFVCKGSKADRQKVLDAIASNATLKSLLGKFTQHFYDEGAWQAKKFKIGAPYMVFLLPNKGNPKKASVLEECSVFTNPADLCATAQVALDKTDPNWKPPAPPAPAPGPGPSPAPGPQPAPNPNNPPAVSAAVVVPWAILAAVLAGGGLLMLPNKKVKP